MGEGGHQSSNFEFNFANPGFTRIGDEDVDAFDQPMKSHQNNYNKTVVSATSANTTTTYYPDFTGSREVGIDVGPGSPDTSRLAKSSASITNPATVPPELPPLPAVPKYSIGVIKSSVETAGQKPDISKSQASKLSKNQSDDDEQDDEINFSYFDMYKKGALPVEEPKKVDHQSTPVKNSEPGNEPDDSQTNWEEAEREEEEEAHNESELPDDSDLQNIFSKDIEESLPELFGSYKSSAVNLNSVATTESTSEKKLFAPNVVAGKTAKTGAELDVVRSRGALGFNQHDKLAIHRIPETETENDDYNEDAEDEHEDDEEESSSYSSFKNANTLDKLKPKPALKVTMLDSSATTDVGDDGGDNMSESQSSTASSSTSSSSSSSSDEYEFKSPIRKNHKIKMATPVSSNVPRITEEPEIVNDDQQNDDDDDPFSPDSNNIQTVNSFFNNGTNLKSESDYFFLNGIG